MILFVCIYHCHLGKTGMTLMEATPWPSKNAALVLLSFDFWCIIMAVVLFGYHGWQTFKTNF